MWQQAAAAYIERNPKSAGLLPAADQAVDETCARLTVELKSGSVAVPAAMDGILIARFYERLGDHAVTIARGVAYLT